MKIILFVLLISILLFSLCGCFLADPVDPSTAPKQDEIEIVSDSLIYIWTDPDTKVQYIVYRDKVYNGGMGGITPRLNSDGTIYISD